MLRRKGSRQELQTEPVTGEVNKCSNVHKLYGYDFLSLETFLCLLSLSPFSFSALLFLILSDRCFPSPFSQLHFNGLSSGFVYKLSWKLLYLLTRSQREMNEQRLFHFLSTLTTTSPRKIVEKANEMSFSQ